MALSDLKPGIEGRLELVVDDTHTAHALGYEGVHVLGTPTLTLFCERAAGQSISFAKGPGDSSVGLHNDIWHLAAARPGDKVVIESKLIAIEGRKLTFELKGTVNGTTPLVKGVHEQVWINLERFLAAKPQTA
jgi:predicted thioesterase